ncbi:MULTISPECIES: bi-domain-containing oxidoreductase [unclassified Lysobacter]|uniref:bi-domain-containing oxidoreductase n=1 Tax=unclassified Lysobacter TaxID=2635362 RepID=UPI001BEB535F|nr:MULTISPECIES: bi-domain-containing oxidoreductase [unclassified Lysobacter]MBT2749417.1 bi-domain-containing oxidoreductase [Lysobacter sp. ISL-42]MBT2753687.1 bi-domain-containing oxidoreductase [Lysobacter sp. ISL-50]MBT2779880.1 bi-domain-containing oxidoreductase [Lysobacter sp. ISL-54]MBT2781929.1 bi-domain-containing oxidoreductase [Lysobacter sp. ISL-52]
MQQVLQNLRDGSTEVADVPAPALRRGHLLIRSHVTLVSAGTERMLVEFGKANMLQKARQQPDKVRMVLEKIRTDGLAPTLDAVRSKLDQPLALGYCNVGTVIGIGPGVTGFELGDRVASNGKHAEVVAVPVNLCAKIPDEVDDESAAFTVLSAIALQGIRLVQPTLGETVVVTGLGLIGLITVQLLRAHGCRVLGIDFDPAKLALARSYGAQTVDLSKGEDPLAAAQTFSRGRGVDAVLITASTKSNEPVSQAAHMCRKRGRIVLVGVTGLELSRADFYEKELSFQVSCSYGPGRYDASYEERGNDYPVAFVRWTEQRNFEAVLDMMASRAVDASALVSHRYGIADAEQAYGVLGGGEPSLGIMLDYRRGEEMPDDLIRRKVPLPAKPAVREVAGDTDGAGVAFIGAGNYAGRVLIPAFVKSGAKLHTVVTNNGVGSVHFGKKYGFRNASTDTDALLRDASVGSVVIATQHGSHAELTFKSLRRGKHVFVEKPLCLTLEELQTIEKAHGEQSVYGTPPVLMVGFNRRFAPQVKKMHQLLAGVREPKSFVMTVNAGAIPADHWTQDPQLGGGRLIGEACHFVDLLRFLAGSPIVSHQLTAVGDASGIRSDRVSFTLSFADGSFGTVHYLANGHKSFPKERLEVFTAGRVLALDNFRKLRGYGWPGFSKMNLWSQDKGQAACAAAFMQAVQGKSPPPIPPEEIFEVARVTIELDASV